MKQENGTLLGPDEAKRMGFRIDDAPKHACPYCGRVLEPLGVVLNGRMMWVGSQECTCPGQAQAALREREHADALKKEEAHQALLRKLQAAGVSKRYAASEVENDQCARYLKRFADNQGEGLFIYGSVGSGKTTLASALAIKFVEAGYRVILSTSIGMLESIQETYGTESSSRAACHSFGECDVLVIDDLGKESASAWSVMTLFQVINMRYESMLPTIVTSQYAPFGLGKRLSRSGEVETAEAIISRLKGTCEKVRLPGGDRRQK